MIKINYPKSKIYVTPEEDGVSIYAYVKKQSMIDDEAMKYERLYEQREDLIQNECHSSLRESTRAIVQHYYILKEEWEVIVVTRDYFNNKLI